MQIKNRSKWGLLGIMLVLAVCLCGACATRNSHNQAGTHVIEGYIVDFNGSRVTVDQVELLTIANSNRINELGLDTNKDFRNGYYIHNDAKNDRKTYKLAKDVQVRFAKTGANHNTTAANSTTLSPVQHRGYTLGGTAGGVLGGAEMLNTRFADTLTVNNNIPYFITVKDGYITHIEEVGAFSNFGQGNYPNTSLTPTTQNNLINFR